MRAGNNHVDVRNVNVATTKRLTAAVQQTQLRLRLASVNDSFALMYAYNTAVIYSTLV